MQYYEYIAPCHFGLEAVLKRELTQLALEVIRVEDGRVEFRGDAAAACRANLHLRTAERVLLKAGEFPASSYEELFENTRALPWEAFLSPDAKFWVAKASCAQHFVFAFRYPVRHEEGNCRENEGDLAPRMV